MAQPGLERLEINYYTVSIGALAGGHVDHTTPEQYGALSDFPTTKILSLEKESANMRWEEIIRQVSATIQPLQISGVVATGADEDTEATAFDFTLAYDRVEYVRTEDELNLGTFLEGVDAVKRWVERALTIEISSNRFIYNPDIVPSTTIVSGPAIEEVTAVKAEASLPIATVSVVAVPDVTDTI